MSGIREVHAGNGFDDKSVPAVSPGSGGVVYMEIGASTKVGEILRDYPELTDWFMDMGLCGCGNDSNMLWTLARLASEKDMDLAALLGDINERIA